MLILVINPGSTSTKIAVFEDDKPCLSRSIPHSPEDLAPFNVITDQIDFRKQLVIDALKEANIPMRFDAIIGRGGLAKPLTGGVYAINQRMIDDVLKALHKHACDLGCIIARDLAHESGDCPCFIADPVVVDELNDYARISGSPLLPRVSIWHALNQRAIARRYAHDVGKRYEDLNLIVCHLGGGISVAAHDHGRAVDVNNALDGEGPIAPERAGTLPAADLIRLCFSGKFTEQQLLKRISGEAGVTAHLGTNNMLEVEHRVEAGDKQAELIFNAMIYHVAKSIAAQGAVLCGKVDAILITGGMARSEYIMSRLHQRIDFLAPVHCYPGEYEMEALASNALAVLLGQTVAKEYV
ncbi:MAG: butyrate kinase [Muribaculaceae bacterium]|nr:butyrate kinase [Muribaculaceae bacterium]MBR3102154.1 butyrate kinase [Muribaculaceae bacterium]